MGGSPQSLLGTKAFTTVRASEVGGSPRAQSLPDCLSDPATRWVGPTVCSGNWLESDAPYSLTAPP